MASSIVKLKDSDGTEWFFEWSSIVDAPVTHRMTIKELWDHITNEYGQRGATQLPTRLKRVREKGTSSLMHHDVESQISGNRAGPGETNWTGQQIADNYKGGE